MCAEQTRSIRRQRPDYRTKSGVKVPGVTTILNLKNKPALVEWAFNLGKNNPSLGSSREYVDDLARIGTCAHEMIAGHLKGEAPDLSDFSPKEVEAAGIPFGKFLAWTRGKSIVLAASEKVLVSEKHAYGGSLDVLAVIDGKRTVLDFKTGKAIYPEYFLQVAAYAEAEQEMTGEKVDEVRILQVGRTGEEGFTEQAKSDWRYEFDAFLCLRRLYGIESRLKNNIPYHDGDWR
jgi:hypothetical protein